MHNTLWKPFLHRILNFLSDPYVKFFLKGRLVYKSKTVFKDLNPFWDESFVAVIEDISTPLEIKVWKLIIKKDKTLKLAKTFLQFYTMLKKGIK